MKKLHVEITYFDFRPYDYDVQKLMNLTNNVYDSLQSSKNISDDISSIEHLNETDYDNFSKQIERKKKNGYFEKFKQENSFLRMEDLEHRARVKPRYHFINTTSPYICLFQSPEKKKKEIFAEIQKE